MSAKQTNVLNKVRAAYVARGISFARRCKELGIDQSNATKAVTMKWKGEKASEIRLLIIKDAGLCDVD